MLARSALISRTPSLSVRSPCVPVRGRRQDLSGDRGQSQSPPSKYSTSCHLQVRGVTRTGFYFTISQCLSELSHAFENFLTNKTQFISNSITTQQPETHLEIVEIFHYHQVRNEIVLTTSGPGSPPPMLMVVKSRQI